MIPEKRVRPRVCEEALTYAEWTEILKPLPDPPSLRKRGPPGEMSVYSVPLLKSKRRCRRICFRHLGPRFPFVRH
jgi:hypothetical protein